MLLLLIISIFALTGCNKVKGGEADTELRILGVDTKNIEKIEIIHGNTIIYPDLEQKDNLTLIEDLNTAIENTGDRLETLDGNLGITLVDAEAYTQKDADNYYVYITFSKQQTIRFNNNSKEELQNCDGVLYDMNNMKLNWSKDSNFIGTMGYTNNAASVEREFAGFYNQIENMFAELSN
jgi:hypothetical protein